jgi:acyl carrier protein
MKEKILHILKELKPEADFETEPDFVEAGFLDSFDVVAIVSELEQAFGVTVDAFDIVPEHFISLETLEALVKKSMKQDG